MRGAGGAFESGVILEVEVLVVGGCDDVVYGCAWAAVVISVGLRSIGWVEADAVTLAADDGYDLRLVGFYLRVNSSVFR